MFAQIQSVGCEKGRETARMTPWKRTEERAAAVSNIRESFMIATTMTASTMVNAAFLQEIKESNVDFWANIRQLRELLGAQDEPRCLSTKLVRGLSDLRISLPRQFSLEETYGYIEGSRAAPMIATAKAVMAKQQHRELYLELQEVSERAEEAQYRGTISHQLEELMQACKDYLTAFDAHEALESELIQCCLGISGNVKVRTQSDES
jgi:hypothetical protein